MIDAQSVIDYLRDGHEALGAFILVSAGSAAWLFQKYISFQTSVYAKRIAECEIAIAIRAEIEILTDYYKQEFTTENYNATLDKIHQMHTTPPSIRPRPLVTAGSDGTVIFDNIKSDLTRLPEDAIADVVKFYTHRAQFDASYQAQGTELFREVDEAIKIDTVKEVYDCATLCVTSGKDAICAINSSIRENRRLNTHLFFLHAVAGIFAIVAVLGLVKF